LTSGVSNPILLVSELFPPAVGGSAVLFWNVYGRLIDAPVTVLTSTTTAGASEHQRGPFQIVPIRVSGSYRGIRPAAALRQHVRVARAIRARTRRKPTWVHCARPLPEGAAALMACLMPGATIRYVCWVHGEDLSAALTSREHGWIARRVCLNAAIVIANSRFTATLVEGLGVPSGRIHVIYPGVDPSRFRPDAPPDAVSTQDPLADPLLLSVGRLQRRKGHDAVIEAIAALNGELPRLRYQIAGDGPERARLAKLAEAKGLTDRVVFLGEVDEDRLPGLYAACDIFVMPNRTDDHDVEGFGIVFLEAAATSRPCIGGRSGGAPEAIADGQTGLLVDGTNAREIAQAIQTLAASPSLRAKMGAAGRARVLDAFTWERAGQELQVLHETLAASLRC
jgi:phosphatidylinositol alpha-1,6-mannosyltransferase